MYPADRELTPTSFESVFDKDPEPRSRLRKLGRVAAWTGLTLVTAIAAALIFASTPWGKELARARIEKALSKKINGAVSIGAVDYTFLFSEVEIRDLRIDDAAGDPAIALERLAVDLDRASLVHGAPVLERVAIDGLDVDVVKRADGTSNLTGLFKKGDREPMHIRVDDLEIRDAAIRLREADGSRVDLSDVAIAGSIDADGVRRVTSIDLASATAALAIARPGGAVRELALAVGAGEVSVDRSGGRSGEGRALRASLRDIAAGPLSIAAVDASVASSAGELLGDQKLAVSGLSIAAAELAALLGRPVLGGDVTADLTVAGPPGAVVIDGAVATAGGTLSIDGSIDAADLSAPRYAISIVGDDIRTATMLAPAPVREGPQAAAGPNNRRPRSLESQLSITASGAGIPGRDGSTAAVEIAAGASVLDLGDRQISVEELTVKASAAGQQLHLDTLIARALGVEIEARGSLSPEREVSADLTITADPARVAREARALGLAVPAISNRPIELRATAAGDLDEAVAVELAPSTVAVAGGRARINADARLERGSDGRMALTRADVAVALEAIDLERAARLAGRTPKISGTLGGELSIERRGAARIVRYDLAARLAKPELALTAAGAIDDRRAVATLRSRLGTVEVSLPLADRGGARAIDLDRDLAISADIAPTRIDEIAALLPPASAARLRARVSGGEIGARVEISGTARAPRASVALEADARLVKLAGKAIEIDGDLAIETRDGRLAIQPDVAIALAGVPGELAEITGAIDLGAHVRGDRLDLRGATRDASLELDVDIARRDASSLASNSMGGLLRASLARAGGQLHGHIAVTGTPRRPRLDGGVAWTGFATAAGTRGGARLDVSGSPRDLVATLGFGARDGATVRAEIKRGATTEIRARARADNARLAELLPALGRDLRADLGTLDWNMDAELAIADRALARVDVSGHLDVSGASIELGGHAGSRRYRDVGLRIEASADRVEITRLSARESDAQIENRRVSITGALELADLRPRRLDLDIRAADWLVFGGSMGQADAPRASVDADVGVAIDMSRPIWSVDATVRSLELDNADRFDRAHVPEVLSVNRDVMFLDEPGVVVGKLAPARADATLSAAAAPRRPRPMDIRVRFLRPARITRAPLDIRATGALAIAVRESGTTARGSLRIVDGTLSLFGRAHALERGRITFDDVHPRGELDLVFARELSPAVARQLSRAGSGSAITVTLSGPLANRQVSLGGAGAGGFAETLAWENAGRGMYHTEPGLPASASVQAPRGEQPLVLTFIQTNLPHMQLLDRFSAWSEPGRDRTSHGRVERFVGERYARENKARVRVVARPETLGRSRAEVHLDHLWINSDSLAVGAGVRAGSRRGGGLGLFLEWSSRE